MTPFTWGLILGVFIGANIGLFTFALLVAAKDGDRHLDPVSQAQLKAEQEFHEHMRRINE